MGRQADLKATARCERCRLPPRWCICAAHRAIDLPLAIDVLMHQRELWRPSSTGHLIGRTVAGARQHLWLYDRPVGLGEVRRPGCEVWVLHPHGSVLPDEPRVLEQVQIVLLDGAWRETTTMAQEAASWGRLVALPMRGESRYWLRQQQTGGRFSTIEALIFVLRALGLGGIAAALQVQFELHVYAGLRSRGSKHTAQEFLRESPLGAAMPEILLELDRRRPR